MTKQPLSHLTTSFADALVALDRLYRAARDQYGASNGRAIELETLWWQLNRRAHDLEEEFGPETVETILRLFCEGHCLNQPNCLYQDTCPAAKAGAQS